MARDAGSAGAAVAAGLRAERPSILWAEDADADRFLIRAVLEAVPEAPTLRFVGDGEEAVAEATRQRPSLVVLDINMPNVDGVEALRRLRRQPELDLPVVMFSTACNEDEVAACRSLGIADYVQKPVAFGDFSAAVLGIVSRVPPGPAPATAAVGLAATAAHPPR